MLSTLPKSTVLHGFQGAVRAREYSGAVPGGVEVWKYALPLGANQPVEEMHVRKREHTDGSASSNAPAAGIWMSCPGRRQMRSWLRRPMPCTSWIRPPPNNSAVSSRRLRSTALSSTNRRSTCSSPIACASMHFPSDRLFRWISEPLDGYGARFRGCGGRVLAVELKQCGPELDCEEEAPSVVRLRTEDGTILRSRFRLARHYWMKNAAA